MILGALRTAGSWLLSKGGAVGGLVLGGAAVGGVGLAGQAGYASATGQTSWFRSGINSIGGEIAGGGAAMESEGMWSGIYAFIQRLGEFIENLTGGEFGRGLRNWGLDGQGMDPIVDSTATPSNNASITPTMPEGVTSENALTIDNFAQGIADIGEVDLLHKAGVGMHGLASGGAHAVSILGHGYDAVDTVVGSVVGIFGESARDWYGDQERDASAAVYDGIMGGVDSVFGAPELRTAWDRALHFGGEVAGVALTGAGVASAFTAASTAIGVGANATNVVATGVRHVPQIIAGP